MLHYVRWKETKLLAHMICLLSSIRNVGAFLRAVLLVKSMMMGVLFAVLGCSAWYFFLRIAYIGGLESVDCLLLVVCTPNPSLSQSLG
jgi:hypothetical protein